MWRIADLSRKSAIRHTQGELVCPTCRQPFLIARRRIRKGGSVIHWRDNVPVERNLQRCPDCDRARTRPARGEPHHADARKRLRRGREPAKRRLAQSPALKKFLRLKLEKNNEYLFDQLMEEIELDARGRDTGCAPLSLEHHRPRSHNPTTAVLSPPLIAHFRFGVSGARPRSPSPAGRRSGYAAPSSP